MTEDIKPITFMKTNSSDLIKMVNENKRPVVITQNGEARAVLMDIARYEKQKEAILLLKIAAKGEEDIRCGKIVEQEKLFARLDKRLVIK